MTRLSPDQEWWTAEEIAAAALPDMPGTKRGVNLHIDANDWRSQAAFARRRAGKGGGWEYSWRLFPARARRKLLSDVAPPRAAGPRSRDEVWAWYEKLPASVQQKAQERLKVIQEVEALERADGKHAAIAAIAAAHVIGARTIWGWFALIEGVRVDDRLPYLAPRNRASEVRGGTHKDCDLAFFDQIKSDYLREEAPPFTDCYRRACRVAAEKGWTVLPERTMRRRLDALVSQTQQILARKGVDALKRMYPSQVRDKTALRALEVVNADYHKFDVFVRWPAAAPGEEPEILRPQMVAFQDVYSGRILSWRVDVSANSTGVLLAAGDMIEAWGIPDHVLMDNGREFAAKDVSGGAKTRNRWACSEEEVPGLFTSLGVEMMWATPYSGQSKPIERAFRDMCSSIAKDPRFAGAYTGNKIDAKPENYRSKAVDLEYFLTVLAEGIEEHNLRQGRRSEVAFGRSFAEVFDESFSAHAIRKATDAQRRLWLLGAKGISVSRTGTIKFEGNEFYSDWMHSIAGRKIVARFDHEDFWAGLHIYDTAGGYLGHAPVRLKGGFKDSAEGRLHNRARKAWMKAETAALKAQRKLSALEIGQTLDELQAAVAPKPEAKVVRPTFGKPAAKAKVSRATQPAGVSAEELSRAQDRVVADLAARRAPKPAEETDRERFRRALQIEDALKAGEAVTPEQQRWASMFLASPPGKAERQLWDQYGNEIFG